ncbi:MAG: hypothetical protein ABR936_08630 [Bacteroidota bacterium]|jgi:hypothetical protein
MKRPHNRIKKDVPIIFEIEESGELSSQDIDAIADFIARLAYNNLKNAQRSADKLIRSSLMEENKNDKRTEQS